MKTWVQRRLQALPLELMNRAAAGRAALRDLEYGRAERQKLDLYLLPPAGSAKGTVLYVHGGYWDSGDKRDYPFIADALLSMGFNVAVMNYRLAPVHIFPDFVTDAALAVRWLTENLPRFGVSKPLFVIGHSAGAHIAALLCCTPVHMERVGSSRDLIAAAVCMAGPHDFLDWLPTDPRMQAALGSSAQWEDTQPVLVADGLNPPLLILHGLRDTVCTPLHAPALHGAITKRGGQAAYIWYEKLDHYSMIGAFSRIAQWLEPRVVKDVQRFLEAQLERLEKNPFSL